MNSLQHLSGFLISLKLQRKVIKILIPKSLAQVESGSSPAWCNQLTPYKGFYTSKLAGIVKKQENAILFLRHWIKNNLHS